MPLVDMFELKATLGIQARWREILYDGEHPQTRDDGRAYVPGEWIGPIADGGADERVACWSFWMNMGGETDNPLQDRLNASESTLCLSE